MANSSTAGIRCLPRADGCPAWLRFADFYGQAAGLNPTQTAGHLVRANVARMSVATSGSCTWQTRMLQSLSSGRAARGPVRSCGLHPGHMHRFASWADIRAGAAAETVLARVFQLTFSGDALESFPW